MRYVGLGRRAEPISSVGYLRVCRVCVCVQTRYLWPNLLEGEFSIQWQEGRDPQVCPSMFFAHQSQITGRAQICFFRCCLSASLYFLHGFSFVGEFWTLERVYSFSFQIVSLGYTKGDEFVDIGHWEKIDVCEKLLCFVFLSRWWGKTIGQETNDHRLRRSIISACLIQ